MSHQLQVARAIFVLTVKQNFKKLLHVNHSFFS